MRTVLNRLREKGYMMQEKLAGDDQGEQWRLRRLHFSKGHVGKTAKQRERQVQAKPGDRVQHPSAGTHSDGSLDCESGCALAGEQRHGWTSEHLADARCQWGGPAWLRDGRIFSRDVGLSMFAASKVLRLRDQHLVKP